MTSDDDDPVIARFKRNRRLRWQIPLLAIVALTAFFAIGSQFQKDAPKLGEACVPGKARCDVPRGTCVVLASSAPSKPSGICTQACEPGRIECAPGYTCDYTGTTTVGIGGHNDFGAYVCLPPGMSSTSRFGGQREAR